MIRIWFSCIKVFKRILKKMKLNLELESQKFEQTSSFPEILVYGRSIQLRYQFSSVVQVEKFLSIYLA